MEYYHKSKEELISELQRLQQIAHLGSFYIDLTTNKVTWSEELYNMYGFDPALPPPLLNDSQTLFTPESWELLSTSIAKTVETGVPYEVELRTLKPDGSNGWMWARGEPLLKNNGKITHLWGVVQDINERKQAEALLRNSEEQFRLLYANMIDGSALHRILYDDRGVPEDYLIVDVNPAYENLLGITREAVIGKTSKEAYGVSVPPYFEIFSGVALTGNPEVFETYFAPLDKHFSISVYCPTKGTFATIFKDITGQKNTENENKRIQKLLEDSQRIGKIGGWELNIDTMELKWTKEMYHIHEVDSDFEPHVDLRANFYTPESLHEVDQAVLNAIANGDFYEIDSEIITAKGNRKWVKSIGKADLEDRRVYGLFQDITERKNAEAVLKSSNEQLKELNATKDKFFSIIAHDLKSPFNGIMGFSEILKKEARNLDIRSIEHYADIINSTANQTYKLLENLLEWAIIQRGNICFEPRTVSFSYLLKTEIEDLKYSYKRKNITLIDETETEIMVTADEKMLRTVIRNLVSNAIKFTSNGGAITIKAIKTEDNVQVSVADTGVGMEKETVDKLFKIETSFTSRGTENEKGTGLGLLLCKEFLEKHGGNIWVDSEKGKGSTFTFSIP